MKKYIMSTTTPFGYESDDTIPRWIENPEYVKKRLENEVLFIDRKIDRLSREIEGLTELKSQKEVLLEEMTKK